MILINPKKERVRYVLQINFPAPSKVEIDYQGLFQGMRLGRASGAQNIIIRGNSCTITQNVAGASRMNRDKLVRYQDYFDMWQRRFHSCKLHHITRARNKQANMLANIGAAKAKVPPGVLFKHINHRSIRRWHPQATRQAQVFRQKPDQEDVPSK